MITNERQYKIAKNDALKCASELERFDEIALSVSGVDPTVIAAQRKSLKSRLKALSGQIQDYERLRSGEVRTLFFSNFVDIGERLVQARVMRGLSQRELAEKLDVKEQQIQRYEQERYATANLVRIAEVAQALRFDLEAHLQMREDTFFQKIVPSIASGRFDPKKLPAREMERRGWLRDIELPEELANGSIYDRASYFVAKAASGSQLRALHRQKIRSKGHPNEYALMAWKAQVLHKARAIPKATVGNYQFEIADVKKLVVLSKAPDGPIQAVRFLRERGVLVAFERHLDSTYLDGAAMLLEATPVIGLTLRQDRLDNFWFVLLHELGHVVCHRDRGLLEGFFDDETADLADTVEREADEFAQNALVPDEVWRTSFVRFSTSSEQVIEFAERIKISPAIVAGRIRRERNDFSRFSDLIGQGEVRKMIVEAGLMEE